MGEHLIIASFPLFTPLHMMNKGFQEKNAYCPALICATQTEKRHPNSSEYQFIPLP